MLIAVIIYLTVILQCCLSDRILDIVCSRNPNLPYCSRNPGVGATSSNPPVDTSRFQLIQSGQKSIRAKAAAATESAVDEDDPMCKELRAEFDAICFSPPPKNLVEETKTFCGAFRRSCLHLVSETDKPTVSTESLPKSTSRPAEERAENDPECLALKDDYIRICLRRRPPRATPAISTREFCEAYEKKCGPSNTAFKVSTDNATKSSTIKIDQDDSSCLELKNEYDKACSEDRLEKANKEQLAFCNGYREVCKNLLKIQKRIEIPEVQPKSSAWMTHDDPECNELKKEYDKFCSADMLKKASNAELAFCKGYRDMCKNLLLSLEPPSQRKIETPELPTKGSAKRTQDDPECLELKSEYDKLCSAKKLKKANTAELAFCNGYKDSCKGLLAGVAPSATPVVPSDAGEASKADEAACLSLKPEYDDICFTAPTPNAVKETLAFCNQYVKECQHLLGIAGPVDYTKYCKKHRERFEYVCPDPLRFGKYAEQAAEFCTRYSDRCPDVPVPSEPVPFTKEKHVFVREMEYLCGRNKHFAETYCTNPVVLKLLKYALPCARYKLACIDTLKAVIYG